MSYLCVRLSYCIIQLKVQQFSERDCLSRLSKGNSFPWSCLQHRNKLMTFNIALLDVYAPDNVGEYDELFVSGKDKLYILCKLIYQSLALKKRVFRAFTVKHNSTFKITRTNEKEKYCCCSSFIHNVLAELQFINGYIFLRFFTLGYSSYAIFRLNSFINRLSDLINSLLPTQLCMMYETLKHILFITAEMHEKEN